MDIYQDDFICPYLDDEYLLEDETLKSPNCIYKGCQKTASYNYPKEKIRLYCKKHKKSGMRSVHNKICVEPGCTISATFNYEGEKGQIYCSAHKKPGMINIYRRICQEVNCKKSANFNFIGETKTLFCKTHAVPGMINISKGICQNPNCQKIPTFNYPGESKKLFCRSHKLFGMVNVDRLNLKRRTITPPLSKNFITYTPKDICSIEDCGKFSSFSFPDEKEKLYCKTHSKPGMINIRLCYYSKKRKRI